VISRVRKPAVFAPLVLALLLVGSVGSLHAQATVTSAGLGYLVPPVDARAAGLGSVGVGLLGGTFSLRNPADLSEHLHPGINISAAPEGLTVKEIEGANTTGRQRMSVIRAVVPFGEWAVALGFGAELDQDWSVTIADTAYLQIGTYPFEEVREQDGGISAIDLSFSRSFGPLSLGLAVETLTGSVTRQFRRQFDFPVEDDAPIIQNVFNRETTSYRGWRFKAGVNYRLSNRFLISGSYGISTQLTADAADPGIPNRSFDMPGILELGASARLSPKFLLTAGGGWSGWSTLNGQVEDVIAYDVLWAGGGVEYVGIELLGLNWPLRLGGRWAQMPFSPQTALQSTEVSVAGGLGLVAKEGVAELSATFEIGKRGNLDQGQIEESFRRLTVSFVLRQMAQNRP
jgi:hypothetical protein